MGGSWQDDEQLDGHGEASHSHPFSCMSPDLGTTGDLADCGPSLFLRQAGSMMQAPIQMVPPFDTGDFSARSESTRRAEGLHSTYDNGDFSERSVLNGKSRGCPSTFDNGFSERSVQVPNDRTGGSLNRSCYVDHFMDDITAEGLGQFSAEARSLPPVGAKLLPFPVLLYRVLGEAEDRGHDHIISWRPHGRAFLIHDPQEFANSVMPKYFSSSQFSSFKRQISWYKFSRIRSGPDKDAYYHEYLLRGRPDLTIEIRRCKPSQSKTATQQQLPTPSHLYNFQFCIPLLDQEVAWLTKRGKEVEERELQVDQFTRSNGCSSNTGMHFPG